MENISEKIQEYLDKLNEDKTYTMGTDQGRVCIWKKDKDGKMKFHKYCKDKKDAENQVDKLNNVNIDYEERKAYSASA